MLSFQWNNFEEKSIKPTYKFQMNPSKLKNSTRQKVEKYEWMLSDEDWLFLFNNTYQAISLAINKYFDVR